MIQAVSIPNNSMLLSMGRSDVVFKLSLFSFVLYAIGFIFGLSWGVTGVAVGYTMANVICGPISFAAISKLADISGSTIMRELLHPMLGSMLMVSMLSLIVFPAISLFLSQTLYLMILMIIAGLLIYLGYSKIFLTKQWQAVLQTIKPQQPIKSCGINKEV
jgi:hypothetical protein